jgi:branched-chain amino acid transport system permease protein
MTQSHLAATMRQGAVPAALASRRKVATAACQLMLLVVAISAPWWMRDYLLLLTHILIVGILALSLDLILGVAGIVSLGHAAFFGLGAYTAGLVAKHVAQDPLVGLACGGLVAGLAGLLCSPLVVRGTDLSRLMVTLGLSLLLLEAANRAGWLTGGADGLQGISMGDLLGVWRFDLYGVVGYFYALIAATLIYALCSVLLRSEWGMTLRALHDQPRRAEALGIPVNGRLASVYTVGAALAGIAGALLAQTTQFVGLEIFGYAKSAEILVILIVGGVGLGWGGFLGAAVYLALHEKLSAAAPEYWNFWLGLFLIFLVLFFPDGLGGALKTLQRRLSGWQRPRRGQPR